MPYIKLNITNELYEKLKEISKKEMRTPSNYLVYHINEFLDSQSQSSDNTLPKKDNMKIQRVVYVPDEEKSEEDIREENLKRFQKLAVDVIGHKLPLQAYKIYPTSDFWDESYLPGDEHKQDLLHYAYNLPYERQIAFINEIKDDYDE
jgi:hypothetical protein